MPAATPYCELEIPIKLLIDRCRGTYGYAWDSNWGIPSTAANLLPIEEWRRRADQVNKALRPHHLSFLGRYGPNIALTVISLTYAMILLFAIPCTRTTNPRRTSVDIENCDQRNLNIYIWLGITLFGFLLVSVYFYWVQKRCTGRSGFALRKALDDFNRHDPKYVWTLCHWKEILNIPYAGFSWMSYDMFKIRVQRRMPLDTDIVPLARLYDIGTTQ